jgi:hypothetical protein
LGKVLIFLLCSVFDDDIGTFEFGGGSGYVGHGQRVYEKRTRRKNYFARFENFFSRKSLTASREISLAD